MDITKTMYKYFDKDKSGVVTVGSIYHVCSTYIFYLYIAGVVIYALIQGVLTIYSLVGGNVNRGVGLWVDINELFGVLGIIIFTLFGIVCLWVLCEYISTIQVVKCELKKEDDNDKDE